MSTIYSFHPRVFSSHMWSMLYFNAFSFTTETATKVKSFFTNLFIPCANCQTDYENWLSLNPLTAISTTEEMVQWLLDYHNSVRVSQNLETISLDYTYLIYNNHNNASSIYRNLSNNSCTNC